MSEYEFEPVGPGRLESVEQLFNQTRATRHCWCTAFCSTRRQFTTGWYGGGNHRRFEAMTVAGPHPMGLVAVTEGEPVGWCACGPRSRYTSALTGRSSLLADRPRNEDDRVWLIACLFVRPDHRAAGVVVPLLRAAVSLAREHGAIAVEAWPLAVGVRNDAEAHVGREGMFAHLGFRRIDRPHPERVIVRLELGAPASYASESS